MIEESVGNFRTRKVVKMFDGKNRRMGGGGILNNRKIL